MADAARTKAMMNGIFISFIPLAEHKLCLSVVSNDKNGDCLIRYFLRYARPQMLIYVKVNSAFSGVASLENPLIIQSLIIKKAANISC